MRSAALHEVDASRLPDHLARQLEAGDVLFFPRTPIPLPPEDDLRFLRDDLAACVVKKNLSYHPPEDFLSGLSANAKTKARARAILRAHGEQVRAFLSGLLPRYAAGWRIGKVNWRPIEEQGRTLRRHSSNELVHIDAFPSGATHGARVLRFFTNVNPHETRVWKSSGLFAELYDEFRDRAGLPRSIEPSIFERALSGMLGGLKRLGLATELIDTSPYDRAMRRLHDRMKDDDAFQRDTSRQVALAFPPFSSWAVLTDSVSHACVRGQHALVNTFYVPLEHTVSPQSSPFQVMQRSLRTATPVSHSA